jgi:ABC-type transport system involved in multi-copper enzyme maturation permease subunit
LFSKLAFYAGSFGYISPFKWVNAGVLSDGYSLGTWNSVVFAGATITMLVLSALIYRRKDLPT